MKEQFVTYEIAIKLKEKGFDEPCISKYEENYLCQDFSFDICNDDTWITNSKLHSKDKYCAAPLWQQVIDWLREKRNIHIVIARNDKDLVDFATSRGVTTMLLYRWYFVDCYINVGGAAESYHEARQAAIEHALTLI
jgi:hypothetical protein